MHRQRWSGIRKHWVQSSCGTWDRLQEWRLKARPFLLVNPPTMGGKALKNWALHHQGWKYFAKIPTYSLQMRSRPVPMAVLIRLETMKHLGEFIGRADLLTRLDTSGLLATSLL